MYTVLLVIGVVIVALAVAIYFVNRREPVAAPSSYVYFRCPFCTKKLRFPASKVGRPGMCPCCRRRWTMSPTPEPVKGGDFRIERRVA
jgi:hypothetical protein